MDPKVTGVDRAREVLADVGVPGLSEKGRLAHECFVKEMLVLTGGWISAERLAREGSAVIDLDATIPPAKLAMLLGDLILDTPLKDLEGPLALAILRFSEAHLRPSQREGLANKTPREIAADLSEGHATALHRFISDAWRNAPVATAALVGTALAGAVAAAYAVGTSELEQFGLAPEVRFSLFGGALESAIRIDATPRFEHVVVTAETALKTDDVTIRASTKVDEKGIDTIVGGFTLHPSDRFSVGASLTYREDREDRENPEDNLEVVALRLAFSPTQHLSVYLQAQVTPELGGESLRTTLGVEVDDGAGRSMFAEATATPFGSDSLEIKAGGRLVVGDGPLAPTAEAFGFLKRGADGGVEHGVGLGIRIFLGGSRRAKEEEERDEIHERSHREIVRAEDEGDWWGMLGACDRMVADYIQPNRRRRGAGLALGEVAVARVRALTELLETQSPAELERVLPVERWLAELKTYLRCAPRDSEEREQVGRAIAILSDPAYWPALVTG